MIIIGERINSTRKSIAPAVKERNTAFIQEEARKQAEGGAHYIDCNAATVGRDEEPEALCWLALRHSASMKDGASPRKGDWRRFKMFESYNFIIARTRRT